MKITKKIIGNSINIESIDLANSIVTIEIKGTRYQMTSERFEDMFINSLPSREFDIVKELL